MPRILVASIFHEAHSFSPLRTARENFVVMRGNQLLAKAATSASGLGGGVRQLRAMGAEPIPVLSAVAPPGGLIDDGLYEEFRDEILAAARNAKPDGIFLDLHGAIASESIDDCEGDLIAALRATVGPAIPIAAAFDLHGSMTPRLLMAADIVVACKQNPHIDYDAAGARACELLVRKLQGAIHPVMAAIWLPMRLRGKAATAAGPLRALHDLRASIVAADPALLDMSLYNTQGPLDAAPSGQCVIAVANGNAQAAGAAARRLAEATWAARADFTPDYPTLAEAIAARAPGRPIILGDNGDRVLAGTPGDGTHVLHQLAAHWPTLRAAVPITDPAAVDAAHTAGQGASLRLSIGGTWAKAETPYAADFTVGALGEGKFIQRGPYLAGESADVGPTALLHAGPLTVLASTRPGWSQDPEFFTSAGIDLAAQDLVIAKSGFHFHLSFATTGPCVTIETPGLSGGDDFPFRRRPKLWPDADLVPDFTPMVFGRK